MESKTELTKITSVIAPDAEAMTKAVQARTSVDHYESLIMHAFARGHTTGLEMLTIREFIENSGFDASDLYVDRFYANIHHDMPILIDDSLLDWIGYKGDAARNKRASFIHAVQALDPKGIRHNQYTYGKLQEMTSRFMRCAKDGKPIILDDFGANVEKRNHITDEEIATMYPTIPANASTKQRKFTVIKPSLLDEVMMACRTERGAQIRAYFVRMHELHKVYCIYQDALRELQHAQELKRLKQAITAVAGIVAT